MFDKDITIVNKYYDSSTKTTTYKLSHVTGFWSSSKGISLNDVSLVKSDGLTAVIMYDDEYVDPITFNKNGKGYTLKNDDYLIKGYVNSITNIADMKDKYESMKITNVSVKDYGSKNMWHFEVSGE